MYIYIYIYTYTYTYIEQLYIKRSDTPPTYTTQLIKRQRRMSECSTHIRSFKNVILCPQL